MKKSSIVYLASSLLLVTSCATVFSGTTQNINVQVLDRESHEKIEGAKCTLIDGQGMYHSITSNPGMAVVTKGKGALQLNCIKEGYAQESIGAGETFNAVTVANVLFRPGFIVDAVSGSMQKYPSHMTVFMSKKASGKNK